MHELASANLSSALPLLDEIKQKVLPHAICGGFNPGRVFVDQPEIPQIALLWSPVGYYFLSGDPDQVRDAASIQQTLTEIFIPASQARGETGFILIPSHLAWKEHLPALLPGREIIEIYRRPFSFNPARFTTQANWRERIPLGFRIQPLTAAQAEQVGVLASWASVGKFLQHGLGFALLHGDEIASVCYSVFASRTHFEIDVHTEEKYQRRGFAKLAASAFIEECLKRGRQPNWECFWENEPSAALAGKLGFSAEPDYPVWFWEM